MKGYGRGCWRLVAGEEAPREGPAASRATIRAAGGDRPGPDHGRALGTVR